MSTKPCASAAVVRRCSQNARHAACSLRLLDCRRSAARRVAWRGRKPSAPAAGDRPAMAAFSASCRARSARSRRCSSSSLRREASISARSLRSAAASRTRANCRVGSRGGRAPRGRGWAAQQGGTVWLARRLGCPMQPRAASSGQTPGPHRTHRPAPPRHTHRLPRACRGLRQARHACLLCRRQVCVQLLCQAQLALAHLRHTGVNLSVAPRRARHHRVQPLLPLGLGARQALLSGGRGRWLCKDAQPWPLQALGRAASRGSPRGACAGRSQAAPPPLPLARPRRPARFHAASASATGSEREVRGVGEATFEAHLRASSQGPPTSDKPASRHLPAF